ncbi:S-methyl-5'-thioadenosine phosphorylase [subsurface metagenome]
MSKIGLIIGYGLDIANTISQGKDHFMNTPYGKPSAKFISGKINNKEVVLLSRHGKEGKIPAFMVNYKANMYVFHEMECSHILATSICGSLQEEIMVGEFVVFDQFVDLTTHCELTYTDKLPLEKLNHSAFHKPFSDDIRNCIIETSVMKGFTVHTKGTVLAVDGPRQSTRAESNLFRHWGADVVNTTTAPEAILAHELGIPYGVISLCTYYDTWRTDIDPATREEKQKVIDNNSDKIREIVLTVISKL